MKSASSSCGSSSNSRTPLFDNTNSSHAPHGHDPPECPLSQSQSQSSPPLRPHSHGHGSEESRRKRDRDRSSSSNPEEVSGWIESIGVDILEELLRKDREKLDSMDDGGMTLLHRSVLANRLELVRVLVRMGANRTLASRDGWSALHLAAHVGNTEMLVFLLKS